MPFAPQSGTRTEFGLLKTFSGTSLTGLALLILRGADVTYPTLHVSGLLTPRAAAIYPQTLSSCLTPLDATNAAGGLPLNQTVRSSANLTALQSVVTRNDPNNLRIKGPILLEQGLSDTTVPSPLTNALSKDLTGVGDVVTYHTYYGVTHGGVLAAAATDATAFIERRLPK